MFSLSEFIGCTPKIILVFESEEQAQRASDWKDMSHLGNLDLIQGIMEDDPEVLFTPEGDIHIIGE